VNFWEKLGKLDRRLVYSMVAVTVIIPLFVPLNLPIDITPEARELYNSVEALPDSSVVLLTFDYYASTVAETEPMSIAVLNQLFRKNMKVITMTTIPLGGPTIAQNVMKMMAAKYGKKYGIDYVNLGYKANYTAVLKGMGVSIASIYPTDQNGTPLSQLPLMQHVKNYGDISYIFVVADNAILDYWISIVNAQYQIPIGAGTTAVMAPKYYSYVQSGQMTGLLGGMKGAAEYELLVHAKGKAVLGMNSQSMVHLLIIAFVILGNVALFTSRRKVHANV
jgi:hypothetical protein